jgi:Uma2 family endonuclease
MGVAWFPKYPNEPEYTGLRLDCESYLALGQTQARYELIDGVVVRHPSPTLRRQESMPYLAILSLNWERANPGAHSIGGIDLIITDQTVYCPDLVFYASGRFARLPDDRLPKAPDVVVEVLWGSEAQKDPARRARDYLESGVREYCAIETADSARVWTGPDPVTARGAWQSTVFSDLRIDFHDFANY